MEKMLERAVIFAYCRALTLGADEIEAFETALDIVFDARPNIDEEAGRAILRTMLADAGDGGARPATLHSSRLVIVASSSMKRRSSLSRVA
ncbi:MAG: hypothetical protein JWL84_4025 [Rhodospirillales bacterium]|jgi:hypothetical protein|nr:hypothetical protein [Rhodospirillales bacterium]